MEKTSMFFSLTLVLIVQCFLALGSAAPSYTTDQSALLALKSHITYYPNEILESNWSTATSICNWVGVTCRRDQSRVTSLDLANMGLKGTIPPHIGNLSFLSYFNINNNDFSGHLPSELSLLYRLKVFEVYHNDFSGEIPSSIFNISSLQRIHMGNNSLEGSLPDNLCHHLPKLAKLSVSWNKLSGNIPSNLGECRELRYLSLSGNWFTGFIPRGIWNFTMLKELYIGPASLQGEVPQEIGNLQSVEILSLAYTNLHGSIPLSLFNMSSLKELYIRGNNLVGSLPMNICSGLSHLEVLVLLRNKLTGSIPRQIGNCTSIKGLDLGENRLSGVIPIEINKLQNMWGLSFSFNKLMGPIPAIVFNMSRLHFLAIVSNRLSGNLPSNMGILCPNLEGLYLGLNKLDGNIPSSISNASNLYDLDLGSNMFSGSIPHSLGNLKLLEKLALWGNNLTSDSSSSELSIITSLTNCRYLRALDLGANPMNGILPPTIGNFSSSIERIFLTYSEINGNIPSEIGNLSSLIYLSLDRNNLTGYVPMTVKGLLKLQRLYFGKNRLHGSIPVSLCHLNNLEVLGLDDNKFSGPLLPCLGNITSLRHLNLSSNRLTSSIPKSLCNVKDLLHLILSSNALSGNLPSELGNFKVATLMDLSRNQFSSEIPSAIGSIPSLVELYLHHNKLDGSIPESFGSLISSESINLSHNNLTGVIPKSLEALFYLKYFNVSFNRLRGEIPSGGPFANFTKESFLSNEALCGNPRLDVPPCHTFSPHQPRRRRWLILAYVLLPIASILFSMAITFAWKRCRQRKEIPPQRDLPIATSCQRIGYYELLRATNMFNESNLLGTGSFSSVYKAILQDGTICAVKVFNLKLEGAFRSFETECEILRNLRHRNLTRVISSCSTPDFKGLVVEYMPNGTLEKWLYSHNYFLDILKRLEIMIDVACALEYLHYDYLMAVVHCDLKPSNVLLDNDMVAKVCDFGIAKFLCGESIAQTKTLATLGYIAPEYGLKGLVSTKCDIYSFGIMLMETFTRTKPTDAMFGEDLSLRDWVDNSMPNRVTEFIDANLLRPNEEQYTSKVQCVSSIMELAMRCSAESPEERMNMRNVLATLKKIKLHYLTNCKQI